MDSKSATREELKTNIIGNMFFTGVGWIMVVTILTFAQCGRTYENNGDQLFLADETEQDLASVEGARPNPLNYAKFARDLVHTASKFSITLIKRAFRCHTFTFSFRRDHLPDLLK